MKNERLFMLLSELPLDWRNTHSASEFCLPSGCPWTNCSFSMFNLVGSAFEKEFLSRPLTERVPGTKKLRVYRSEGQQVAEDECVHRFY
jgi:hypothetical protein